MGTVQELDDLHAQYAASFASRKHDVKKLQAILSREQGRAISLEEAAQVASDLIGLYKALAGDKTVVKGGLKNIKRLHS